MSLIHAIRRRERARLAASQAEGAKPAPDAKATDAASRTATEQSACHDAKPQAKRSPTARRP